MGGRALAWLDDVAWDPTYGGYWGSFRRNNERYPDGAQLPTPDGRDILGLTPGFKENNTLGRCYRDADDIRCARHRRTVRRSGSRGWLTWWSTGSAIRAGSCRTFIGAIGDRFPTRAHRAAISRWSIGSVDAAAIERRDGPGDEGRRTRRLLSRVRRVIRPAASASPSAGTAARGHRLVRPPTFVNGGSSSKRRVPCMLSPPTKRSITTPARFTGGPAKNSGHSRATTSSIPAMEGSGNSPSSRTHDGARLGCDRDRRGPCARPMAGRTRFTRLAHSSRFASPIIETALSDTLYVVIIPFAPLKQLLPRNSDGGDLPTRMGCESLTGILDRWGSASRRVFV